MTTKSVNELSRAIVTAAWGVATLVLLFLVLLLGYELYNRGDADGASAITLEPGFLSSVPSVSEPTGTETRIKLYFGSPYSSGLRAEDRLVVLHDDILKNCKAAFRALASGPRTDAVPVLPSAATVRAMYLTSKGDLVVDLSRDVDVPELHSASAEMLMVRAITMTLSQSALRAANAPSVRRVQFLFEGAPTGSHFPAHIKLDFPMEPEASWVVPPRPGVGNG